MAQYQISEKGLKLLRDAETLRLIPYDDQTGKETKVWTTGATIGFGHLINQAEWSTYKNGITETPLLTAYSSRISRHSSSSYPPA